MCSLLPLAELSVFHRGVKSAYGKLKLAAGPQGVSRRNVLALSARALIEGISSQAIVNGFAATGIWPLNPERLLRAQRLDLNKIVAEIESAAEDLEKKAVRDGVSKDLNTDVETCLGVAGTFFAGDGCVR